MFGYVVANVDALSAAEKERYRAVYCGLCRALGQAHGQRGRLTLTYDMTFLILLLSALDKTELATEKSFRCALHPLQRRTAFENRHTRYAADMNLMLAYHQKMDDWVDERKPGALLQAKAIGTQIAQLNGRYPRQKQAIDQGLAALSDMEKNGEGNPDLPASAFGGILGSVFTPEADSVNAQALFSFGSKLGRFIYLMDAAVDLKKDIKREKYNPLVAVPSERHEEILRLLMADCAQDFDALPLLRDKGLMENILYSGVWSRFPQRRNEEVNA